MGPGLPGIGIASLFYVALALFAPIRELVLTARGESSVQRWRMVGTQFALGLAVLGSVVLLFVGIDFLMGRGLLPGQARRQLVAGIPNYVYMLVALAGVLLAAWVYAGWVHAGRWLRTGQAAEHPDAVAAAHPATVVHEPSGDGDSEASTPEVDPPQGEDLFNYQRSARRH